MAKQDFYDILEQELDKNFSYDFELNLDKRNHAVELSFLLEYGVTFGEETESVGIEEFIIFYNPDKSKFDEDEFSMSLPYTEKGLSAEFIKYFVGFLQETADQGLDDLIDYINMPETEEDLGFAVKFDKEKFAEDLAELTETEFYKYPRY